MNKILRVDQLTVGMFVVSITQSNGSAVVASKGLIKNLRSIERLKALKIEKVEIDPTRSLQNEADEQPYVESDQSQKIAETANTNPIPLAQELPKAKAMYTRAAETQRKAFEKIKLEGDFDVAQYEMLAEEFFQSITNNQDALLCMTKLQNKDSYLLEHSINVGILLAVFAKHLGLSKEIGLRLTLAGLLHDMGKVQVPDAILNKKGKLTNSEFHKMKKHPDYGAEILKQTGVDGLAVQIAQQHHERLSGSGYPQGLKKFQINQYVRMSCIVDVFDAITAERVYKKAMTAFQAFRILKDAGGAEFDNKLLNSFIQAIGFFSIGTVVQMTSEKLAIVVNTNYAEPLKPTVAVFYHPKYHRHIEIETIDLSSKKASDKIDKAVNPADFDVDINAVIKRLILDQ